MGKEKKSGGKRGGSKEGKCCGNSHMRCTHRVPPTPRLALLNLSLVLSYLRDCIICFTAGQFDLKNLDASAFHTFSQSCVFSQLTARYMKIDLCKKLQKQKTAIVKALHFQVTVLRQACNKLLECIQPLTQSYIW